MIILFAFILSSSYWVSMRGANITNSTGNLRHRMRGERYVLVHDPATPFAPKPKLSPRSIPKEFDVRKKWPRCKNIFNQIRDQGACASSWAVCTAAIISQIHCIHTDGELHFTYSAQDILSCAPSPENDGCKGNSPEAAFKYWMQEGVPSGGEYDSHHGCLPYSQEAFYYGTDQGCTRSCSNDDYPTPYAEDKRVGSEFEYERIRDHMPSIQHSIMTYGPVMTGVEVYEDFFYYDGGYVYRSTEKGQSGGHILIIFGWGEENGIRYWLCQNSFGKTWGMDGYIKFIRGRNYLSIEENVVRVISKAAKEEEITTEAPIQDGKKNRGRQSQDIIPEGEIISGGKRYKAVSSYLYMFSMIVLSNF